MILNDPKLLICGISQRLKECYAAELMCLVLGFYEGSHFYGNLRVRLHRDLDMLLKGASNHDR